VQYRIVSIVFPHGHIVPSLEIYAVIMSISPSVCRHSTKTAKHRMTNTAPVTLRDPNHPIIDILFCFLCLYSEWS